MGNSQKSPRRNQLNETTPRTLSNYLILHQMSERGYLNQLLHQPPQNRPDVPDDKLPCFPQNSQERETSRRYEQFNPTYINQDRETGEQVFF